MSQSLEARVGRRMRRLGLTVACAESCTGGLLAHRLTNVPGSSAYFLGGVVAYSPEIKTKLLGVPGRLIGTHGVVSGEVALAMAQGARRIHGASVGIGVTGVAGPGPGAHNEPQGLMYVALAAPGEEVVRELKDHGGRAANKRAAATVALQMLGLFLERLRPPEAPGASPPRTLVERRRRSRKPR